MSDLLEIQLRDTLAPGLRDDDALEDRALHAALAVLPRPRTHRRRVLGLAVAVAGTAAAVGLILVLPKGTQPPPASTAAVSILNRPQGPADHLPGWVAADPGVRANAIDPGSVRLALRTTGRLFFVARGRAARVDDGLRPTGSRTICLVTAPVKRPTPSRRPGFIGEVSCRLPQVFARKALMEMRGSLLPAAAAGTKGSPPRPCGSAAGCARQIAATWTLVVPDGYTRLRLGDQSWPVVNNVVVANVRMPQRGGSQDWRLTGPAGTTDLFGGVKRGPGDAGPHAVRFVGIDPDGPSDRPFEPMAVKVTVGVLGGFTKVSANGVVAPVVHGRATLNAVPASPFEPLVLHITGPAGTSSRDQGVMQFLGRGRAQLKPPR